MKPFIFAKKNMTGGSEEAVPATEQVLSLAAARGPTSVPSAAILLEADSSVFLSFPP